MSVLFDARASSPLLDLPVVALLLDTLLLGRA
jgi:hypothetical protein